MDHLIFIDMVCYEGFTDERRADYNIAGRHLVLHTPWLSSADYVHFPLAIALAVTILFQSQCLWILDT